MDAGINFKRLAVPKGRNYSTLTSGNAAFILNLSRIALDQSVSWQVKLRLDGWLDAIDPFRLPAISTSATASAGESVKIKKRMNSVKIPSDLYLDSVCDGISFDEWPTRVINDPVKLGGRGEIEGVAEK